MIEYACLVVQGWNSQISGQSLQSLQLSLFTKKTCTAAATAWCVNAGMYMMLCWIITSGISICLIRLIMRGPALPAMSPLQHS